MRWFYVVVMFLLFSLPEPYQKTCRISYDGKLLATGGDDGKLRVWTFPDLNNVHEIEAHKKEIDDLEFRLDFFFLPLERSCCANGNIQLTPLGLCSLIVGP